MTPAEKSKRTRLMNKLLAEEEARISPIREEFYEFCSTFYPERDAKLKAIDEMLEQAIAQHHAAKEAIMDEFRENIKVKEQEFEAATKESWNIYKKTMQDSGLY